MTITKLALVAVLALSACGKDKKPAAKADDKPAATEPAKTGDQAPAAGSAEKKADDKGGW